MFYKTRDLINHKRQVYNSNKELIQQYKQKITDMECVDYAPNCFYKEVDKYNSYILQLEEENKDIQQEINTLILYDLGLKTEV